MAARILVDAAASPRPAWGPLIRSSRCSTASWALASLAAPARGPRRVIHSDATRDAGSRTRGQPSRGQWLEPC